MSVKAELRAMTDDERSEARRLLWAERNVLGMGAVLFVAAWSGAVLGVLAGTIVIVLFSALLRLPAGDWMTRGQATCGVLGFAVVAYPALRTFRARALGAKPLEEDVAGGFVEVLDVEAFIAWPEFDRDGPGFRFDVAEATELLIRGKALAPHVDAGTFPAKRFTVVRLPASKHVLRIEPRGEPLTPRA